MPLDNPPSASRFSFAKTQKPSQSEGATRAGESWAGSRANRADETLHAVGYMPSAVGYMQSKV
jgi:hypothetical protein